VTVCKKNIAERPQAVSRLGTKRYFYLGFKITILQIPV